MCGIAGVIRFGDNPIKEEVLSLLLQGNEHRGTDATGIALAQPDGSVAIYKQDMQAWKFVASDGYKSFLEENLQPTTWAAILHTRAATKGNPRNNNNNHPMFAGLSAVIHNGVINNDTHVFDSLHLKRQAETDSDIIRAIADKYGITEECITYMNRLTGSAAGAILSPGYPRMMMLFRSGSPMMLASTEDFMAFASEKNTLHRALRPWKQRFKTWFQVQQADLAFAPMADNTAWIVNSTGVDLHREFKSHYGKYVEPHREVYDRFPERQARWDNEHKQEGKEVKMRGLKEEVQCPRCKKLWVIPASRNPNDFYCNTEDKGCGSPLVHKAIEIVH